MSTVLYVYAIAREAVKPHVEAVDKSSEYGSVSRAGVHGIYTRVPSDEFSQESIDRRSADLEWLGSIGYRHQAVVSHLMKETAIIPLRAFTLFRSEESLAGYLDENGASLANLLERLAGKQEWTLRIELDPKLWNDALVNRVASMRDLQNQIRTATAGKAFLLRKKLDEERKRASRVAEEGLVAEIEQEVSSKLACETIVENRQEREGAFPQVNVLINRDEEAVLQELHAHFADRYSHEGVTVAITGPWPPYTFASAFASAAHG